MSWSVAPNWKQFQRNLFIWPLTSLEKLNVFQVSHVQRFLYKLSPTSIQHTRGSEQQRAIKQLHCFLSSSVFLCLPPVILINCKCQLLAVSQTWSWWVECLNNLWLSVGAESEKCRQKLVEKPPRKGFLISRTRPVACQREKSETEWRPEEGALTTPSWLWDDERRCEKER